LVRPLKRVIHLDLERTASAASVDARCPAYAVVTRRVATTAGQKYQIDNARIECRAMSPASNPNPTANAEARRSRDATAKAKKLLREGMARLEAALDDSVVIEETPLEARDAMQLASEAMRAALHQLDAAD
jgi:hypothetical protein